MLKDMTVTLVVVNFVLFAISAITLGLRCYIFFLLTITMSTMAAYNGVGVHHCAKAVADMKNRMMVRWPCFISYQLFHVTSTVPVKASICVSLLRITPSPVHERILWTLIVVSICSTIMACIVVFTTCRPMAYMWDKTISGGKCNSLENIIALSYVVSGVNIVTDWTCAVVPAIILWDIQM
ncbi:hypothetical protein AOQ84DRAFT_412657 [Glonium stellatum]|uniref:Rhodopsin domain-containing protein n=1 Tax=Glonium stellatum TaxID=574774 RepID=A0A8E2JQY0_9PEZI|nr:hypothetical protein AOQ84DRAFT_412657 [Glonium stellatum]